MDLPNKKVLGIAGVRILPAGCPSCHPTNSVKALKEFCQN